MENAINGREDRGGSLRQDDASKQYRCISAMDRRRNVKRDILSRITKVHLHDAAVGNDQDDGSCCAEQNVAWCCISEQVRLDIVVCRNSGMISRALGRLFDLVPESNNTNHFKGWSSTSIVPNVYH